MVQKAGETTDTLMVQLRKHAQHCNFGESFEDNLRDQLIERLPGIKWNCLKPQDEIFKWVQWDQQTKEAAYQSSYGASSSEDAEHSTFP